MHPAGPYGGGSRPAVMSIIRRRADGASRTNSADWLQLLRRAYRQPFCAQVIRLTHHHAVTAICLPPGMA